MSSTWSPHSFLSQIELLDPSQQDKFRDVFVPKGGGPVAASKHFVWLLSNLLRGVSPGALSVMHEMENEEVIEESAIRDYCLAYVPPALMSGPMLIKYLQMQPGLDETETLDFLRKYMTNRLCALSEMRTTADTFIEIGDEIRKTADMVRKLCVSSLDVKLKTGQVKAVVQEHMVEVKPAKWVDDDDGREVNLDPRTAAFALQFLHDVGIFKKPERKLQMTPTDKAASS